jgi:plasmid rolling circle replication initiator protein Rep
LSTKPIRVHDLPEEAKRLWQETENLLRELNARGPTTALLLRAKDLRKRVKAQGNTIQRLVAIEAAVRIAFRERTLRNPEDGDTITAEDDARAEEIVDALQSPAGTC